MAFTTDPQLWTPMFGFVDYARAPDAEVELDGIHLVPTCTTGGSPRCRTGWTCWSSEPGGSTGTRRRPAGPTRWWTRPSPRPGVTFARTSCRCSRRTSFAVAVRSAFKAATRPAELASNPLPRSRILPRPATVGELRDLLGREVEELAADPRRARLARVLTVTYLTRPPPRRRPPRGCRCRSAPTDVTWPRL